MDENKVVEQESQHQQDLETARKLAKAEAQRADEQRHRVEVQTASIRRLRWLVAGLVVLVLIACAGFLIAGGAAWVAFGEQQKAKAEAKNSEAEAKSLEAETKYQAHLGRASELAAMSQAINDPTGSLDLILAREAVFTTWLTDTEIITQPFVSIQADAALREAIETTQRLPWRKTFPWRERHTGGVWSIAFSPDGSQFVSGSDDQTMRLWDVASGEELRLFNGHTGSVRSVAFSPDGSQSVRGGSDHTVRLWDMANGEELRLFSGHTDIVWSVAFSPDGSQIVSGSAGQTVRLWRIDIESLLKLADSLIQRDPPVLTNDERTRFGFEGRNRAKN